MNNTPWQRPPHANHCTSCDNCPWAISIITQNLSKHTYIQTDIAHNTIENYRTLKIHFKYMQNYHMKCSEADFQKFFSNTSPKNSKKNFLKELFKFKTSLKKFSSRATWAKFVPNQKKDCCVSRFVWNLILTHHWQPHTRRHSCRGRSQWW